MKRKIELYPEEQALLKFSNANLERGMQPEALECLIKCVWPALKNFGYQDE